MRILRRWFLSKRIQYLKNKLADLKVISEEQEQVRTGICREWHETHAQLHSCEQTLAKLGSANA